MLRSNLDSLLARLTKALFYLLILTVPFVFTWVNEELFEFPKMLVVYGLALFIIGSWLARMIVRQEVLWRRSLLDIPHLIFLGSQLISTVFSLDPHTSWFGYYTRFHGGLLSTLTYLALFHAFISTFDKKELKKVLIVLTVACFGISLYAFPEHFGVSPSCILIEGKATASCWVQDVQSRVFGTLGQPNWLAAYLLMLLPVVVAHAVTRNTTTNLKKVSLPTVFAAVTAVLAFVVILFTRSRSGFLGLALGSLTATSILALSWVLALHQHTKLVSLRLPVLVVVITLMLVSAAWFGTPFSPSLEATLSTTSSVNESLTNDQPTPVVDRLESGGTDSGDIRKIVWTGALQVWQRYPVFGSGVETFAYSYYLDRPREHNLVSEWDFLYNKAHNELLNILANTGIVGLLSYLVVIGIPIAAGSWYLLRRPNQLDQNTALLIAGLIAGLVGLHISNFFGFSTVPVGVLMVLFHGLIILLLPTTQPLPTIAASKTSQDVETSHWIGLIIISLLTFFGTAILFRTWTADRYFATGKAVATQTSLTQGVALLEKAVELSPNEAGFYDSLSYFYAQLSVALANDQQATAAAQVATAAIATSQKAISLNPAHTILYKGQVRMYLILANLDERYLQAAIDTLQATIKLAPTDAKLWYQLGAVQQSLGEAEAAEQSLLTTINLKPDYEQAYLTLANVELELGKPAAAQAHLTFILEQLSPQNEVARQQLDALTALLATTSAKTSTQQ